MLAVVHDPTPHHDNVLPADLSSSPGMTSPAVPGARSSPQVLWLSRIVTTLEPRHNRAADVTRLDMRRRKSTSGVPGGW